jgi:hypothetical protein
MPTQKLQTQVFLDEFFVTTGKTRRLIFTIAKDRLNFLLDPKAIFAEILV